MNKNIKILILLCTYVYILICPVYTRKADPGWKTTITDDGLAYFLDIGLKILQKQIDVINLPDINGDAVYEDGDITYQMNNLVLSKLNITKSVVSFLPPSSAQILAAIDGYLTMDWTYTQNAWPHLSDQGSAYVIISEMTTTVEVSTELLKGRPTVKVTSCSVEVSDLDIEVENAADWVYDLFTSTFSGEIKQAVEKALPPPISNGITTGVTGVLATLPVVQKVDDYAEVDYELVAPIAVHKNYFTLHHRGEFFQVEDPDISPYLPATIPDIDNDKMVQMFVSDYVANSASFSYFTSNVLRRTLTDQMLPADSPLRLNTTYFTELIPSLENKFPNTMMELVVYATETPTFSFSKKGAIIRTVGNIDVYVLPTNGPKSVAFTLGLTLTCDVLADLKTDEQQTMLTAKVSSPNIGLSLSSTSIGHFNVYVLQSVVNEFVQIGLIPVVNTQLAKGFAIPNIPGVTFVDPTIRWGQGYMCVSSSIVYDPEISNEN